MYFLDSKNKQRDELLATGSDFRGCSKGTRVNKRPNLGWSWMQWSKFKNAQHNHDTRNQIMKSNKNTLRASVVMVDAVSISWIASSGTHIWKQKCYCCTQIIEEHVQEKKNKSNVTTQFHIYWEEYQPVSLKISELLGKLHIILSNERTNLFFIKKILKRHQRQYQDNFVFGTKGTPDFSSAINFYQLHFFHSLPMCLFACANFWHFLAQHCLGQFQLTEYKSNGCEQQWYNLRLIFCQLSPTDNDGIQSKMDR